MKLVGMMCVKDEADLLPEVLPHTKALVDDLLVYEDGSTDSTWDLIGDVAFKIKKEDDERLNIHRPNYHRLLETAKKNYDYNNEPVWMIICMGDRFWLNKTPRQCAEEGEAAGMNSVEGIQLDFLRCREDPWTEENDTFPVWNPSLREQCRWFKPDEKCIVAFKLTDHCTYAKGAKYPWPQSIGGEVLYGYGKLGEKLTIDQPFLEHQGRRSPKAAMWRANSGSRPQGSKYAHYDYSTFQTTVESIGRFYNAYRLWPWAGLESIEPMIECYNRDGFITDRARQRNYFRGIEYFFTTVMNRQLPARTDI
jgi:hypothetical protein